MQLKDRIREQLVQVVERCEFIDSATLTGSFLDSESLEGISDIDFVLVVDRLNRSRFESMLSRFDDALRPLLKEAGFDFRINPTLGPLKFNDERLAVLHLMIYSREGHVEHVIQSPFTCLDWQRSNSFCKQSLAESYPAFGLQPRHFLSGRRSPRDYLRDLTAGVVSYRELICDETGYTERKQGKPMTVRDRHEFAYHVMRFLMQNLLKLLRRDNRKDELLPLLEAYFRVFPEDELRYGSLLQTLAIMKRRLDFSSPIENLLGELEAFVASFERQFRSVFFDTATRHLFFRHAPTAWNLEREVIFQGRSDLEILPETTTNSHALIRECDSLAPSQSYCSPLVRTRQSLQILGISKAMIDERLSEIDYGHLEGLTVSQARSRFPALFAAWGRGEDPPLPGEGESTAAVLQRLQSFLNDRLASATSNTVICSHNVVLRSLVGSLLNVPRSQWVRLRIPHLAPLMCIQTREHGLFLDLSEEIEREIFADWNHGLKTKNAAQAA